MSQASQHFRQLGFRDASHEQASSSRNEIIVIIMDLSMAHDP